MSIQTTFAPGTRIGPWQLDEPLDSGGMGTLWRAHRADGAFEQRAAIKLIRAGMDSAGVLARFENERAALATLAHESIARLYGGGTAPDGRPYLAMELVDGSAIDVHCERRALDLAQRLALVAEVCDAVHHAHQRLVVHCDLKPSNVLVTAEGRPKLLDFGLAQLRSTGDAAQASSESAEQGFSLGYASPEQLRGERVTTASDVFSLGALLHELLARAPAFDADRKPATEPPAPSRAAADREETRPLARRLAGDLDAIVRTAMHPDPARRYASAEHLAADIRRHLAGLAVLARPDTLAYRASKFARRNVLATAAVGVALLALVAGLIASTALYRSAERSSIEESELAAVAEDNLRAAQEAQRAESAAREHAELRFADLKELAASFIFDIEERVRPLRGSEVARAKIADTARRYLDTLTKNRGSDEALAVDLARAWTRLGGILRDPGVPVANRSTQAVACFQRAVELYESAKTGDDKTISAEADTARRSLAASEQEARN